MMIYTFRCPECCKDFDEWMEVNKDHSPGTCPDCGAFRYRVFNANIRGDEFKSGVHFNPDTRREEKYHGGHFDIGLGKWVESKSERKRYMKELGFQEAPPSAGPKDGED